MSVKGLVESEGMSKALLSKILKSLRLQSNEIKQELDKVRFLLSDNAQRAQWLSNPADSDRAQAIQSQLDETEQLYLTNNNSEAAKLFKERMAKVLKEKMTNLESYEAEVRIRTAKIQEQVRAAAVEGFSGIKKEAALRELYSESHSSGGFYVNFGKAYLNDLVTLETKAAGSKTLGDYMKNLFTTYESQLRNTLVGGIVRGDSYDVMAKNLADDAGITERKAALLVNTESNAIFNASVSDVILSNPLVKGYRFRAVLDSRTSDICQELDGQYFDKEEMEPGVNYPPMHPNCRSTIVTVLVDEDENNDTRQRYTKNDQNQWEKVPPGMTYGQYKERFGFSNSTKPVDHEVPTRDVHDLTLASGHKPEYVGYIKPSRSAPGRIEKLIDKYVADKDETMKAISSTGSSSLTEQAIKEAGYDSLPTSMTNETFDKFVEKNKLKTYVATFDSDEDMKDFVEGKMSKPLTVVTMEEGQSLPPRSKRVALRTMDKVLTQDETAARVARQSRLEQLEMQDEREENQDVLDATSVQYGFDAVDTQQGTLKVLNRSAVVIRDEPEAMPSVSPTESVSQTAKKVLDEQSKFSATVTREARIAQDDGRIVSDGGVRKVPGVIASSSQLDHKIDDKYGIAAQRAYDRARSSEEKITGDMLGIADKTGSRMAGLETDVKSGSSTSNKIDRWREKMKVSPEYKKERQGLSDAEVIGSMPDIVRYTYMSGNDELADTTNTLISELQSKGYTIAKVDNKFMNADGTYADDVAYRAIHIDVVSPTGQKVEVQIHSNESLAIRELTHPLKEQMDKLPVEDVIDREKLIEEQRKIARQLKKPKGIESVKSFVKK